MARGEAQRRQAGRLVTQGAEAEGYEPQGTHYRCPKCKCHVEVTVGTITVACWRCRRAMRRVRPPAEARP